MTLIEETWDWICWYGVPLVFLAIAMLPAKWLSRSGVDTPGDYVARGFLATFAYVHLMLGGFLR